MRKLTKREFWLLYLLICLIVAIVGWMILAMPALEAKNKEKNAVIQAKSELSALETNQSDFTSLQDQNDNLNVEMNNLTQKFAPVIANEEIVRQLTTLAQKHHLKPADLQISKQSRIAIVSLDTHLKQKAEKQEPPKTKDGLPKGTQCDALYVTMKVYGSQNNAAALAADVYADSTMRLNNMSVDNIEHEITFTFIRYLIPLAGA